MLLWFKVSKQPVSYEEFMEDKIKLVFAPGAFDTFDGSQEELDDLVKELNRMIEDGSFWENTEEIDENDKEVLEWIENISIEKKTIN